ncbi:hypothetical protein [Nocardia sp. NPDC060255]|uniref:hypothetical protein n=2 Tax=unclassified Nocardia TaxID=2637762 RepID=UPI0036551AB6
MPLLAECGRMSATFVVAVQEDVAGPGAVVSMGVWMGFMRLRRRCRSLVSQMDLPAYADAQSLCRSLSERRGRPIFLHPLPPQNETQACGLWLETDEDDHIFFEQQTSLLHQDHILYHELGHMLCDHDMQGIAESDAAGYVFTDLGQGLIRRLLGRTNYTTRQEQEAEMIAGLLHARARNAAEPLSPGLLGGLESRLRF